MRKKKRRVPPQTRIGGNRSLALVGVLVALSLFIGIGYLMVDGAVSVFGLSWTQGLILALILDAFQVFKTGAKAGASAYGMLSAVKSKSPAGFMASVLGIKSAVTGWIIDGIQVFAGFILFGWIIGTVGAAKNLLAKLFEKLPLPGGLHTLFLKFFPAYTLTYILAPLFIAIFKFAGMFSVVA